LKEEETARPTRLGAVQVGMTPEARGCTHEYYKYILLKIYVPRQEICGRETITGQVMGSEGRTVPRLFTRPPRTFPPFDSLGHFPLTRIYLLHYVPRG
jgi:hypothetical protein